MRKFNSVIAGLILAGFAVFLTVEGAEAFCVHNDSDRDMRAQQVSNGSVWRAFNAKIDPGDQACCPWTEKDCNKSGGKTDPVGLNVFKSPSLDQVCMDYTIPANGDLYINGKSGNYSCSQ